MTDTLFSEVRELILAARKTVSRGVDIVQVLTNYEIGRRIVEYEQEGAERAAYGKQVLKALSARLGEEFGRGFSRSNLEYMRKFYLTYRDRLPGKSQAPSGKLIESGKSQTLPGKTDAVVFMEKVLVQNSQLFRSIVRDFVAREVTPVAARLDEAGELPRPLFARYAARRSAPSP